jgi:signal transduction histidine kinase
MRHALWDSDILKQRLQLALQASQAGVWEWDLTADHKLWDARMFELYKVSREDFDRDYYGTWARVIHPEDRDRVVAHLQAAVTGQCEYRIRFRLLLPEGGVRYIDGLAILVRNDAGEIVKMIGVNTDVTESALALHAAEQAVLAKDQFISKVSHELRTPMNGIMGLASLITKASDMSQIKANMRDLTACAQAMLGLLNHMLDFSKLEAGKVTLECVPFDPWHLLSDVSDLLAPAAQLRGLTLEVFAPTELPHQLMGDA